MRQITVAPTPASVLVFGVALGESLLGCQWVVRSDEYAVAAAGSTNTPQAVVQSSATPDAGTSSLPQAPFAEPLPPNTLTDLADGGARTEAMNGAGASKDDGPDAGTPACESSADCDDGLRCNGAEVCSIAGRCVAGVSPCAGHDVGPSCDDSCDEETGECTAPDQARTSCAAARLCDGMGSCVECLDPTDCTDPLRPTCDPSSKRCVRCSQDSDCTGSGPCWDPSCTPEGACAELPAAAGRLCGDGATECSEEDRCDGDGTCVPLHLDAGTLLETLGECLRRECDGNGNAVSVPDHGVCSDQVFCNGVEQCDSLGGCVSPGNPCSGDDVAPRCNDSCDEASATCSGPDVTRTSCDLDDGEPGQCNGGGACVECFADNECVDPARPFCDASGSCAECLSATDCTDAVPECSVAACVLGRCVSDGNREDWASCDDEDSNTVNDACFSGDCIGRDPVGVVATAFRTSCAVRQGGRVYCWGELPPTSENGIQSSSTPVLMEGVVDAVAVAIGDSAPEPFACVLRVGGRVTCWGNGIAGQLGVHPDGAPLFLPREVPGLVGVSHLASGVFANAVIAADSRVLFWGAAHPTSFGPTPPDLVTLDDPRVEGGTFVSSLLPAGSNQVANATALAIGLGRACALSQGRVLCWGVNEQGELGTGQDDPTVLEPSLVLGLEDAVDVDLSGRTCAARSEGQVVCWGSSFDGDPSPSTDPAPVAVEGLSDVVQLNVSFSHACGLHANGQVSCWGTLGESLAGGGAGSPAFSDAGVVIPGVEGVLSLARTPATTSHQCALQSGGEVICWGSNTHGQSGSPDDGSGFALPSVVQGLPD